MLRRVIVVAPVLAVLALPCGAAAQDQQTTPPAATPATAQPAPPPAQGRNATPQLVNIRLDLTISVTEPKGGAGTSKTVFMHIVDRDNARIRTGRSASGAPNVIDPTSPVFNVDALPEILRDGRIRVSVSFEFRPARVPTDPLEPIHINERVAAILEDGKPLVVSQAVDPSSDRLVRVELKATTLK